MELRRRYPTPRRGVMTLVRSTAFIRRSVHSTVMIHEALDMSHAQMGRVRQRPRRFVTMTMAWLIAPTN
jgi:hypothetical protein